MVLVDLLAFIGDLISYTQDRQANENFLVTAQDRANVIRHLQMIGYVLSTAKPASVTLTFTLPSPQATSVVVNLGDRITTQDGTLGYETQARLEIPAGSLIGTVTAIEGLTISEFLASSDGSASQKYTFGQIPYIFGSELVTVDGIPWTFVTDFLSSTASSQVYTVSVDAFDAATITFGDGINGARPGAGAQIAANYRIGGGTAGNVDVNNITKLPRSYATVAGVAVAMTVTNTAVAQGGTDRESTQHGQLFGPKALSTQSRSVSSPDYAINAMLVPGVARALAQVSDDDPTIDDNTVLVQVVPTNAGAPTQTLIDAVYTMLTVTKPKPNTTRVIVAPAAYANIAPVGTFYVARQQVGQSILEPTLEATGDAFLAALQLFFSPSNIDLPSGRFSVDFGKQIALSKLFKIAESVAGVSYFDMTSPAADVVVPAKQFPRLGAFTKTVILGPPILIQYTWTLTGGIITVREEP